MLGSMMQFLLANNFDFHTPSNDSGTWSTLSLPTPLLVNLNVPGSLWLGPRHCDHHISLAEYVNMLMLFKTMVMMATIQLEKDADPVGPM